MFRDMINQQLHDREVKRLRKALIQLKLHQNVKLQNVNEKLASVMLHSLVVKKCIFSPTSPGSPDRGDSVWNISS